MLVCPSSYGILVNIRKLINDSEHWWSYIISYVQLLYLSIYIIESVRLFVCSFVRFYTPINYTILITKVYIAY